MIDGLVSIITPMHNAEEYIAETIESVQAQIYTNWEMIIVDDCSTDQSGEMARQFANKDVRIRYIKQDSNKGIAKTRNHAMQIANGRYLAFLDSDDKWLPNKLEKQIELMSKLPEIAFCHTGLYVIDENSNRTGKVRNVPEKAEYEQVLKGNSINCLTVLIDREKVRAFEMPEIHHEDYATWLDILKTGVVAYGIDEPLAEYRETKSSASGNKLRAAKWHWNVLRKHQGLPFGKCLGCFISYAFKAVMKRV